MGSGAKSEGRKYVNPSTALGKPRPPLSTVDSISRNLVRFVLWKVTTYRRHRFEVPNMEKAPRISTLMGHSAGANLT
jgi:hypothetical protein